ncbi:hypothetical protein E7T06_20950 [Deinococcus sp. Arct2-2]|uniref:hypothetical protein n=1 Tax=Deinococcus sp. Arct2-2 TaxID=2568653 RepID=UPI0010A58598|nr:hypothetical protein [Deinococcus sp. Arct2-2]THF66023.1 hypothetical protein E7T06_20950 [Deinococcus sp. Arct2-2]
MSGAIKSQSRGQAVAELLVRGSLYGVGAAALSAGLGYLRGQTLAGALDGLNWAGILLWILAGAMIYGSIGTSSAEVELRSRLGEGTKLDALPFAPMLMALIAGCVCFLVAWSLKAAF